MTEQEFIAEVVRLVNKHPDAIYEKPESSMVNCYYLKGKAGGGCGCLFGQALVNLGFDRSFLLRADKREISASICHILPKSFSEDTRNWSVEIQVDQDTRRTWQQALDKANELYPKVLQ